MTLTADDLFSREMFVRMEAERRRLGWPISDLTDPSVSAEVKLHTRTENERADELDQIGDLLMALQDDWGRYGPMLRDSHARMLARAEAAKVKPSEDKTEAAA